MSLIRCPLRVPPCAILQMLPSVSMDISRKLRRSWRRLKKSRRKTVFQRSSLRQTRCLQLRSLTKNGTTTTTNGANVQLDQWPMYSCLRTIDSDHPYIESRLCVCVSVRVCVSLSPSVSLCVSYSTVSLPVYLSVWFSLCINESVSLYVSVSLSVSLSLSLSLTLSVSVCLYLYVSVCLCVSISFSHALSHEL